jgi:hypothetical protein
VVPTGPSDPTVVSIKWAVVSAVGTSGIVVALAGISGRFVETVISVTTGTVVVGRGASGVFVVTSGPGVVAIDGPSVATWVDPMDIVRSLVDKITDSVVSVSGRVVVGACVTEAGVLGSNVVGGVVCDSSVVGDVVWGSGVVGV